MIVLKIIRALVWTYYYISARCRVNASVEHFVTVPSLCMRRVSQFAQCSVRTTINVSVESKDCREHLLLNRKRVMSSPSSAAAAVETRSDFRVRICMYALSNVRCAPDYLSISSASRPHFTTWSGWTGRTRDSACCPMRGPWRPYYSPVQRIAVGGLKVRELISICLRLAFKA